MVQSRIFLAFVLGATCLVASAVVRTETFDQGALWGFLEKTIEKHHNAHFERFTSVGIERENSQYKPLTEFEQREIEQVREAFKSMDEIVFDAAKAEHFKKTVHTQETVMTMMDVAIERIVKTLLRISHFQKISREGQMHLLKKTMMNLLTIRGIVRLDEQSGVWNTPVLGDKTQISLDLFDHINCPVQKERFLAFAKQIDATLRKDQTAMELISLVAVFRYNHLEQVEGINVQDLKAIRFADALYFHLLQRYVESVYGERSVDMLKTVPKALDRLEELNRTSVNIFGRRDGTDY